MSGTLYLVATPIGNLEDITFRAVRILKEADLIACEDTRHSRTLLEHYGIHKPVVSCHEHNEEARAEELVVRLLDGAAVALISDAGTPLVSDPGYRLVTKALERGIAVQAIPGPSAALAALAASGLPTDEFRFAGFLPSKASQRRKTLELVRDERATVIFYEAPHRILETLCDIDAVLPGHPVVLARELTKLHEEFLRGTAGSIEQTLAARPPLKGEITLLIGKSTAPPADEPPIPEAVEEAVRAGLSRMDAMKEVARRRGISKREVYRALQNSD
jgi:16S rRNA (cytidine1402-2'-O)-methyltransferase